MLSLAKVRILEPPIKVSFTIKNLFGMIPGPGRGKYHGKNHKLLDQSITDIFKVYDSLFQIKGIIEAVFTASLRDLETMGWKNIENPGFVAVSKNPIDLDAFLSSLFGIDPHNIDHLVCAAEALGPWDEELINLRNGKKTRIFLQEVKDQI
jgi:uncharacterized protein (DUF362 family)